MVALRHFLSLRDRTASEYRALFERSHELKRRRRAGQRDATLVGRTLVLLMEKASTRTRLSFAAAIGQLGGHAVELAASTSQLARGEPIGDTARVVSGYADAVVFRTSADARLAEYTAASGIPVINGLSDGGHPVQVLTDLFTVEEALGSVAGRTVAFIGDCAGNMARSFLEAAPIFGFSLRLGAPEAFRPPPELVKAAGGRVAVVSDPAEAVRGAEVVSTDVWTSMGQEHESEQRRRDFAAYQLKAALLRQAHRDAMVMHCLPAHRGEEITDDVIDGPQSIVFDQAENRLHAQKAILERLLAPVR